ncbi:MAG: ferrochelatase [Bacteroidia bacterium]
MDKYGILLMAYGSPGNMEEIEPYYIDIRRGRRPTREALQELQDRYLEIGGTSPLLEITNQQAESLQNLLGANFKVYVGMRHWTPWIHEAVQQMAHDGIRKAVGIVMSPHYSSMSIERYKGKVRDALYETKGAPDFLYIDEYHNHPLFIQALTQKIEEARQDLSPGNFTCIFTAHSLPERILDKGDPYADQLMETSRILAEKAGLEKWEFAYQSAGRTEEKWLGPDLTEMIKRLHDQGENQILICPIGFIIDHLEVLYDIDIEAQQLCQELGMKQVRTTSLNSDPLLIKAFAQIITEKING